MRTTISIFAFSVLFPALAAAQSVSGAYVNLGGGVDFLSDQIEKPYDNYGPRKRSYNFYPGAVGYGAVGYGLGYGFRAEAEFNFVNAVVRGVRTNQPERAGGYEQQYGGLLNIVHDFNLGLPVTPYVGLGAGYQRVGVDNINSDLASVATHPDLKPTHGAFAYQGIVGFSYPVSAVRGLALTVDYRALGVLTPAPYYRGSNGCYHCIENGVLLNYRGTFSNIINSQATVGIRYAFGGPPGPLPRLYAPLIVAPVPAPVPAPARTYLVFFDWDRSDLSPRARQIVAEAASASTRVQTTRIEVDGYTDLSGTAAYNQKLSVRRAEAVRAELVQDGVAKTLISIHGYGESNPLVPTAVGVREPQNRRVEIILR